MRSLAIALVSLTVVVSPAAAAGYVLNLLATTDQSSRYEDGQEIVDNTTPTSAVRIIEPREKTPRQSSFRIFVFNNGERPFNFGPENIVIKLNDGTSVLMMNYNDLLKQQERREAWQALAVGLSAAGRSLQASQAGYSYGSAIYSGNSYGTIGSTLYSSSSFGTTRYSSYNATAAMAAKALADEQNRRDIEEMSLTQAAQRSELEQYMKTTTIDPGQSFGGVVQYRVPAVVRSSKAPVPISIEVRTGDEIHIFPATLSIQR